MSGQPETQPTDFPADKAGWARRWKVELEAARKALEDFVAEGKDADRAFRDEREVSLAKLKRRNLYSSNVITQEAMLYGQTPKTDVSREFADANDDVARAACELLERIINSDVEKSDDFSAEAFGDALNDRLIPGLGVGRVRYEVETEKSTATPAVLDEETGEERAPAVPSVDVKSFENACIDYVHWTDFLWGACRVWSECPWVAFGNNMGQEDFGKRFGAKLWALVPKWSEKEKEEEKLNDPMARVRVWEIWHKASKKVFWYVEGYINVLDIKDDPLQLYGFFPCAKPWIANRTTSKLVPVSDWHLHKDSYDSINTLTQRRDLLVSCVRAAGVYDKSAGSGMMQLLNAKATNILIPVENWALFAEKGGVRGQIDWLPLDQIVQAITVLSEQIAIELDALFQDSGLSDIMRGQATQAGATATEQAAKARFGSVRMQRLQDEFASFVSDLHRLKGEVVCKHFDPETILERANAQYGFENPQLVQEAVALLKSDYSCYRIKVKPESVALQDFAALRSERTEVIDALGSFMQRAAPLAQAVPGSMMGLTKMLKHAVAGLKGADGIEGVLDAEIDKAEQQQAQQAQNPQQPPPDPKLQAEQLKAQTAQMKGQADIEKEKMKLQNDLVRIQAETQAKAQQEETQRQSNVQEAFQKQAISNVMRPPEPVRPGPLVTRKPGLPK